jgi:hypothetical protein
MSYKNPSIYLAISRTNVQLMRLLLLSLNTRTFNRPFLTHVGISPVAYRKIARFRHSLKNKLFNDQFKKLTEIEQGLRTHLNGGIFNEQRKEDRLVNRYSLSSPIPERYTPSLPHETCTNHIGHSICVAYFL